MSAEGSPRRARNFDELRFFVSLQACPHCGRRLDEELFDYHGNAVGGSIRGKCRQCQETVWFPVHVQGDLLKAPSGDWDELAPGASELVPPHMFIDEVLALSPTVKDDPTTLAPREWQRNREANKRARVSLNELAKMVPAGADRIADSFMTDEDRRRFAADPAHYQRTWIESLRQRHVRIGEANVADLPRVNALEAEEAKRRPKGVDFLERAVLDAHEKWVERGMKGSGRLVLVRAQHRGLKIGRGAILSRAQIYDCDLAETYLEDAKLEGAELTTVRLDEAKLYGAFFHGTSIKDCTFKKADLSLAEFKDARIDGGDFFHALLDMSEWAGATAAGASFETATFGNANLDGAQFRNCSFKGADFKPSDPTPPPPTRARFEHCDLSGSSWEGRDLSGAVFVGCTLTGATGRPARADGVIVDKPVGDIADVLRQWGVTAHGV